MAAAQEISLGTIEQEFSSLQKKKKKPEIKKKERF
jgi:hypothetical protein